MSDLTSNVLTNDEKFHNELRKLLVKYEVPFALIWLKEGDDLKTIGFSEDGVGAILCQAMKTWLEKNQEKLLEELEKEIPEGDEEN